MEKLIAMPRGFAARIRVVLFAALFGCGIAPAFAQGSLAALRQRGELVIATDATYPPFEFKDGKTLKGFDIDIGNAIGKELGVNVHWAPLPWDAVLGSLETGKCDIVLSGVTITEERKKKGYNFSRPYFLSGQTIARRKGDE